MPTEAFPLREAFWGGYRRLLTSDPCATPGLCLPWCAWEARPGFRPPPYWGSVTECYVVTPAEFGPILAMLETAHAEKAPTRPGHGLPALERNPHDPS